METTEVKMIENVCKLLSQRTVSKNDLYEARVTLYEILGCTRSDAQGIVDAEDLQK
jgi:hypothetical protein